MYQTKSYVSLIKYNFLFSFQQLFQKAILMSIFSLRGLFDDMKARFGIKYIMTAKLNQDALENLFSIVRTRGGGNDHPSPMQFLRRLRVIILGKSIQSVSSGQSTEDRCSGEEYLVMDVLKGYKPTESTGNSSADAPGELENDVDFNEVFAEDQECDSYFITEQDGFEYVVGAVARKFRAKYPYVGDYTYRLRDQHVNLTDYSLLDHDYAYPNSYVDHLSLGGLTNPSGEFMQQATGFESFFKSYHKDSISKDKGIVAKVANLLLSKNPDVPAEIVEHFIRLRTYIRISTLNRKIKEAKTAKASVKRLLKPANKPAEPTQKKMRKILM